MPSRDCTYYIASAFVTVEFLVAFVVVDVNSVLAIVTSEGMLIGLALKILMALCMISVNNGTKSGLSRNSGGIYSAVCPRNFECG